MESTVPIQTVLAYSGLAAAMAALGALPFAFRKEVPLAWLGLAYALASGLMLGASYLLILRGLAEDALQAVAGGGLGVAYTFWTQIYARTHSVDPIPESGHQEGPEEGYKVILQNTLHSASEGVAIGVAMTLNLRLGIFVALALAVHNVSEAMVLTAMLRHRGMSVGESAGLCIVVNSTQMLLAISIFAVSPLLGDFLPLALGFASGSLLFLVMTELLPASYRRAGKASIALIVSLAAGAVVLLEEYFV